MECQRQFTRVQGHSARCNLMKPDGSSCQATLENISIGGAMIKTSEGVPNSLNVGDACTVTLCSGSGPHESRYSCEIVWCDQRSMGIQFITKL
jgi:hypothetical protein